MNITCLDGIAHIEVDDDVLPNTCLVISRVADYDGELGDTEESIIQEVAPKRRREFTSGRRAAHVALRQIGMEGFDIGRRDRAPVWPDGIVGSITHSGKLAAGIVGNSIHYGGLGLDLVPVSSVSDRVAGRILHESERRWVEQLGSGEWRTALFSAKESIYKAVNPIIGEYLSFNDVELSVSDSALEFTASTSRDLASSDAVKKGRGYIHRIEGHWLTLFAVAN